MDASADQFTGCLLGLATGDALGAPHEGGPLERFVWRIIGRNSDGCWRWTDDTQMALDLAGSLLDEAGLRPEALAMRFALGFRWSRGYGPAAARVLKRIRRGEHWESASRAVYADGSYGNGAAMRAPVLALYFADDRAALIEAARESARVTHAHPWGIEGAVLIALATHALMAGRSAGEVLDILGIHSAAQPIVERMQIVRHWIQSQASPSPREVASSLGNGMTAPTSVPTALYVALRHLPASFETMMAFIIACRGDVDTTGAMAGALWGIVNGPQRLPPIPLEARSLLEDVAMQLFHRRRRTAAE